jgi:hypothetical protein
MRAVVHDNRKRAIRRVDTNAQYTSNVRVWTNGAQQAQLLADRFAVVRANTMRFHDHEPKAASLG